MKLKKEGAVSEAGVRNALKWMKNGKAVSLDDIPV